MDSPLAELVPDWLVAEAQLAADECEVCELYGRIGRELEVDDAGVVLCRSCSAERARGRRRR